jgi:Tfp pilus assembly protein PilN
MKAVNLLPPDLRGAPKKAAGGKPAVETPSGIGAYIVLGVLATAVAALAVYVLASNAVKDREAKLATVQAEAQNAQQRAAALKPYADFEALANQRLTTVRSLAKARFDWNRALQDLSRALPKDAALTEISGDVSPTSGGGGGNSLRGALPAPALSLKGCVSSQTGVAKVMSRLGNIQGVTRVTLASSDKDATPDSSGVTRETQTAPYCGKGTPPTFDLVVFFERDTARVGAAPGLADPNAAGTPSAPAAAADATKKAGTDSTSTNSTSTSNQGGGSK